MINALTFKGNDNRSSGGGFGAFLLSTATGAGAGAIIGYHSGINQDRFILANVDKKIATDALNLHLKKINNLETSKVKLEAKLADLVQSSETEVLKAKLEKTTKDLEALKSKNIARHIIESIINTRQAKSAYQGYVNNFKREIEDSPEKLKALLKEYKGMKAKLGAIIGGGILAVITGLSLIFGHHKRHN